MKRTRDNYFSAHGFATGSAAAAIPTSAYRRTKSLVTQVRHTLNSGVWGELSRFSAEHNQICDKLLKECRAEQSRDEL